jgi:hypothetical protein
LRPDIGFGAFISYSGPADRALISKLQNGIEKLAKRWYRAPVMKVFVDKTSIAAGTRLWSRIESGLSRSKWLILMASPEAAQSWWVDREVGWWVQHRSLDNLIIVHTAGVLRWDRDVNDFSADSDAIPPCLRGKFEDEPVWVAVPRTEGGADVEAAVLSITAAVREASIHELSSRAYREHRRTLRWAGGAIATLSLLLVAAVALSMVAVVQKRHADQQARIALSRQLASTSATELSTDARAALLLAVSAYRINANAQTLAALMRADTANPRLVRYYDAGSTVTLLAGSSDGKTLVAGGADGRVLTWSFTDPKPTTVIKLSSAIASIGVSGDGSVIAATDKHTAALCGAPVTTRFLCRFPRDRAPTRSRFPHPVRPRWSAAARPMGVSVLQMLPATSLQMLPTSFSTWRPPASARCTATRIWLPLTWWPHPMTICFCSTICTGRGDVSRTGR